VNLYKVLSANCLHLIASSASQGRRHGGDCGEQSSTPHKGSFCKSSKTDDKILVYKGRGVTSLTILEVQPELVTSDLQKYCLYILWARSSSKAKSTHDLNWITCSMNYVVYNDVWNYKQYGQLVLVFNLPTQWRSNGGSKWGHAPRDAVFRGRINTLNSAI